MGNSGAQAFGLEKAEVPVADSVAGMIKVVRDEGGVDRKCVHGLTCQRCQIEGATKEKTSGRFMFYDGTEKAW